MGKRSETDRKGVLNPGKIPVLALEMCENLIVRKSVGPKD